MALPWPVVVKGELAALAKLTVALEWAEWAEWAELAKTAECRIAVGHKRSNLLANVAAMKMTATAN
jgi:hypothetical protein